MGAIVGVREGAEAVGRMKWDEATAFGNRTCHLFVSFVDFGDTTSFLFVSVGPTVFGHS